MSGLILAIEKLHKMNYLILGLSMKHILFDSRGYPHLGGFS